MSTTTSAERLYPDISNLLSKAERSMSVQSDDTPAGRTTRVSNVGALYPGSDTSLVREQHTQTGMSKKKLRTRRMKKVLGWGATVTLFPIVLLANSLREKPTDRDDPYDVHNDPLRPWDYKVDLHKE